MKTVGILVPRGEVMPNAILGAYFLLTQANFFLQQQGRPPVFDVRICGYKTQSKLYDGSFSVRTDNFKKTDTSFDLLIIPGFICEMELPLQLNKDLIAWMKTQYLEQRTELASMCTGAFLLAATGLLEDKKCTSHWAFEGSFRRLFPRVNFLPDHIVTDDRGFYSSGGAYSSLNLILYLIEKFCSREAAVWTSKVFQLDLDRKSQKPFIMFNTQKAHADEAVSKAQAYIEKHYADTLTVHELAARFAFSRRNFIRRFKLATGNTPIEYIQRVRIEAAKRLLETTGSSVEEITYQAGYSDGKSFRTVFKKLTGFLPSDYRRKYSRS